MMRSVAAALSLAVLLATSGPSVAAEGAQTDSDAGSSIPAGHGYPVGALSSDPGDPGNLVPGIDERLNQKESLFPVSPLYWLHQLTDRKKILDDSIGLKLAAAYTQVFMALPESLPGSDSWGTNSNLDLIANWALLMKGKPTEGHVTAHGQGRWDWGTTSPEDLALVSLGSLLGTANSFGPYDDPSFILRNLYWEQGSKEAGWAYRIGKITPDAMLGTSAHMANALTFLPTANYNFSIAVPDSGLGAAAAWYPHSRIRLMGLISDSNADRSDWGHIDEGDLFKAIELAVQIAPRTEKAGYSKLVFWHNDGTRDGSASNGNLGPEGWGFLLKLEQELTADGRLIGIARYGRSFNDSAAYKQLASAHLLLYDPRFIGHIRNDLVGIAFNWAEVPVSAARSEYNVEAFYRFPIFPSVDMTLSYQSVINPALDRDNDHASVFSLRLRTTF